MEIIKILESKKEEIKKQQALYDTKEQDNEIMVIEKELNRKVEVRNNRLGIYNDYDKQIQRIDQTIRSIEEMVGIQKEDEENAQTILNELEQLNKQQEEE